MAKVETKSKLINLSTGLIERIEEVQNDKHLRSFTATVEHLLLYAMDKMYPAYTAKQSTPRKTEVEKLMEKEEAKKYMEKMEYEEQMEAVRQMGAIVTDKHGIEDANGTYFTYTIYTLMPGRAEPRSIVFTKETNPLWMAPEMAEKQYEGGTKEEIDQIIKSGNYREMK